jgi:hypothetical protein
MNADERGSSEDSCGAAFACRRFGVWFSVASGSPGCGSGARDHYGSGETRLMCCRGTMSIGSRRVTNILDLLHMAGFASHGRSRGHPLCPASDGRRDLSTACRVRLMYMLDTNVISEFRQGIQMNATVAGGCAATPRKGRDCGTGLTAMCRSCFGEEFSRWTRRWRCDGRSCTCPIEELG